MIEDFYYKGYRVIITECLRTFSNQCRGKPNQQISIVGLDDRTALFLDQTSFTDAKAEIMAHIDQGTLDHL